MDIFYVEGNEAKLIAAATSIESAAEQRARVEAGKTGGKPAMTFFASAEEAAVVIAADDLRAQYKEEFGLAKRPILLPYGSPLMPYQGQHNQGSRDGTFHRYERRFAGGGVSHVELAKILLTRVWLKRCGEAIYAWHHPCFRRLTDNQLSSLILGNLRSELGENGSASQLAGVSAILKAEPNIEDIPLEASDSHFLCVKNGLLDLDTLRLSDPSPAFFFTSFISVDWCGAQPCPTFDGFVAQISGGDPILTKRVWQMVGYALTPDNCGKRFIVLQGEGDSGKSVFTNLLESFFEPLAVSQIDIHKGNRFSIAALADRRLNIASEMPRAVLGEQNIAVMKAITGGDTVSIEEKYKAPRSAKISCKLVFSTNHEIVLPAGDEAFARRMLLIPFRYSVPKTHQDPHLLDRLLDERAGILYRAILEYRELRQHNYIFAGDDRFTFYSQTPETSLANNDGVELFVQQCCDFDRVSFTATEDLFATYSAFCAGKQVYPLHDKTLFSHTFSVVCGGAVTRDKQRVAGRPKNGYRGVSLKGGDV